MTHSRAVVCFTDEALVPFSSSLEPGFRHVYCLIEDMGTPVVIMVNATTAGAQILYYHQDFDAMLEALISETGRERDLLTKVHRVPVYGVAMANNCVGLTKRALNFSSSALTPFGLYKDLLKSGAVHVQDHAARDGWTEST